MNPTTPLHEETLINLPPETSHQEVQRCTRNFPCRLSGCTICPTPTNHVRNLDEELETGHTSPTPPTSSNLPLPQPNHPILLLSIAFKNAIKENRIYALKALSKQFVLKLETNLPSYIGGSDPDMLLGFRVPDLTPQLEFSMPNGLGCFRCPIKDVHGSDIFYGGSHHIISEINKIFGSVSVNQLSVLLQQTVSAYQGSPWMTLDENSCAFQPLVLPMGKL